MVKANEHGVFAAICFAGIAIKYESFSSCDQVFGRAFATICLPAATAIPSGSGKSRDGVSMAASARPGAASPADTPGAGLLRSKAKQPRPIQATQGG